MELKERLQNLVDKHERGLASVMEEKLEENPDASFHDLYTDEDGMPYSFGNADDVYSDGFSAGIYQGIQDVLIELKVLLGDTK